MGNRLSKIVTRTGDTGSTGLGDGSRIGKDSRRIDALGEVDELNSSLGVLLAEDLPEKVRAALFAVQNDLFDLGGELCCPGMTLVSEAQVERLEADVEAFNAGLSRLKEFILPGGTRAAALAHLCRAVARRAERSVVALAAEAAAGDATQAVSASVRRYLNRLSDLLFVLGRYLNAAAGGSDVLWVQRQNA